MKKNLIIVIVVCVLLVAGSVVFLYFYDKKQKETGSTDKKTTTPTTKTPTAKVSNFPLQKGSNNADVKKLQAALNTQIDLALRYNNYAVVATDLPKYAGINITSLDVDGVFGNYTLAVVRWYFKNQSKTSVSESEFNSLVK